MRTQKLAVTAVCIWAAASALAQKPTISIQVVDNFGAPKGVIPAAQKEATRILGAAGVNVDWRKGPAPNGLTLFLVERRMVPAKDVALGYSFVGTHSVEELDVAHLLYPAIERKARDGQTGISTVLGAVMAHEIGHLLLNSNDHSPTGVMSAVFEFTQIAEAARGHLLFTASQAARIRSRVTLRGYTDAGVPRSPKLAGTH